MTILLFRPCGVMGARSAWQGKDLEAVHQGKLGVSEHGTCAWLNKVK